MASEPEKTSNSTTPAPDEPQVASKQTEFGILPVPSWLVHREGQEFHFGILLNAAFGLFATFSNVLSFSF